METFDTIITLINDKGESLYEARMLTGNVQETINVLRAHCPKAVRVTVDIALPVNADTAPPVMV